MKLATKTLNSKLAISGFVAGCRILLAALLGVGVFACDAVAWGPHPQITEAALKTLPDAKRWSAKIGDDNLRAMARNYCMLPDMLGMSCGTFYANDYLLIRAYPRYTGHTVPETLQMAAPYFRRALQALRTETPVNACRQIGPILHFVEDAGAPPHAYPNCPHHPELENWVRPDQIVIAGYQPQLLGQTDDEAVAGLMRRMTALVEFSIARAKRVLPLVSQPSPDRSKVEPIILESALESARVTADLLHTLFTLGQTPQPEGASLSGDVTVGAIPGDNHGVRIMLLNTDYSTLTTTEKPQSKDASWHGGYAFHNLPSGSYRVLAYRTGSQLRISEPIVLKSGKQTRLDFVLPETDPPGNLIENPDGRLAYVKPDIPDRWSKQGNSWTSNSQILVKRHTTYRCGAILKDPAAKVSFYFYPTPYQRKDKNIFPLEFNGELRAEAMVSPDAKYCHVVVHVESSRPLTDAIEKVWLVSESQKSSAAQK